MKNLIITGGNTKYFEYLKPFIKSLRKYNNSDVSIIVCDNTIKGKWNKPGTFRKSKSFTKDQLQFFEKNTIKVEAFSLLLNEFSFSREIFDQIVSGHWAYPAKYIYTYLIANKYKNEFEKIAFFDADIIFQGDVDEIFNQINEDNIYLNHEFNTIKNSTYMSEWIDFSKKKSKVDSFNIINLDSNLIYCTGFFAGKTEAFLRVTNLAVVLASNKIYPFHNDQPLMNILVHTYKYPFRELGPKLIHLAHVDEKDIVFSNGIFTVKQSVPIAIHYHGKHREFVKSKIIEDYGQKKYKPTTLEKIWFQIKKLFR